MFIMKMCISTTGFENSASKLKLELYVKTSKTIKKKEGLNCLKVIPKTYSIL